MAKVTPPDSQTQHTPMRPAINPEARENQMIALAEKEAERQMREGTASSQIIVHYLKLGSTKERIERTILERQAELITAKTEALQSAKRVEELYANAIAAMKRYSGGGGSEVEEEEDDY